MPFSPAIGAFDIGFSPIGDAVPPPAPLLPVTPFFCIEIDTFKPGVITVTTDEGHGTHAHGALVQSVSGAIESQGTILASDVGYRSSPSDVNGAVPYPPFLNQPFQIDVAVNLDPLQSSVGAAWGSAELSNATRRYDSIARAWNSDGRSVRVYYGEKPFDPNRQYWVDPPFYTLSLMFSGLATPWFLSDTALTVPLRDATYWLDRPYQTSLYGGTGGYDGTASLVGKPLPRTRGGFSSNPVCNVTPTLLDPVNLIYQYNDARGTVQQLYEGGARVITRATNTTNLYSGSTPAGWYRTDNSRGLFQLGSPPVHAITADVTGEFPLAGAVYSWAAVAKLMLSEDMAVPAVNIRTAAFDAADARYPYLAGIYFGSDAIVTGVVAINAVISGVGARLVPFADGTLAPFVLRDQSGAVPVAEFNLANIVTIMPVALPASVSPPPYRIRVGYDTNYTVQTSDINAASSLSDHLAFIGLASQTAAWSSTDVLNRWRRPNDPPVIPSALTMGAQAEQVASDLGALWGTYRRLYNVTVPVSFGHSLDIGDIVSIRYPMDDLDFGQTGQIVRRALSLAPIAAGSSTTILGSSTIPVTSGGAAASLIFQVLV